MRLAAYAGASTALAGGVVIYAFNQRANFYSACVYLSQSNLCLMILTNLILLVIASFMFGLQRIFYGPLRPIEIEQLYEKAWFAVTETCLAMTIFREEVGAWFLVMFVALLAGKVWGWIGEGRVEILEQQPPANPRLVHIRLSLSLALSLVYDTWILGYTVNAVIQQARPNMMVMFLFEFAVLATSSSSTALRYCISLIEARIIKKQTQERLEWRRREVREEREEILRQRTAAAAASEITEADQLTPDRAPLPSEDDVDEMDIEVPGWEAKGQWVLTLDLMTDFVKLAIYSIFFFVLLIFYGLPIHIMRDLFLTARSFIKRLTAFLRYRKATHDMNERYPDASVEEIQREDTCIICREEMRPWSVTNPAEPPVAPATVAPQPPAARLRTSPIVNERSRPKKLPCGHVLHLGCLKSWLERQQVCPTCRRPVVDNGRSRPGHTQQPGQEAQAQGAGRPQAGVPGAPANGQAQQPNGNVRMINFGPLRFAFGQANNMQDFAQRFPGAQPGQQNAAPGGARMYGLELGFPRPQPPVQGTAAAANGPANSIQARLQQVEQQIMQDIVQLRLNQNELQIVQQLQSQLVRIRSLRQNNGSEQPVGGTPPRPQTAPPVNLMPYATGHTPIPRLQQHAAVPGTTAISSGSSDLPPGVVIPDGWSLLPLQRVEPAQMTAPSINGIVAPIPGNPADGNPTRRVRMAGGLPRPVGIPQSATPPASDLEDRSGRPSPPAPVSSGTELSRLNLETLMTNNSAAQAVNEVHAALPNLNAEQLFRNSTAENPSSSSSPPNGTSLSNNPFIPRSSADEHSSSPPALSHGGHPHPKSSAETARSATVATSNNETLVPTPSGTGPDNGPLLSFDDRPFPPTTAERQSHPHPPVPVAESSFPSSTEEQQPSSAPTENGSAVHAEAAEPPKMKSKGKAKAATVEDESEEP